MNAIVINLKRSKDRMSYMTQQLDRLNISFKRIEAVDAHDIDSNLYHKHAYDWNRILRRVEVACFFSHKKAWEYVVKQGEPSIIFEDDVILSEAIVDALNYIGKHQKYNFINLETSYRKKLIHKRIEPLTNKVSLSRLLHNKSGAAAYILSPKYARFLLSNYKKKGVALADAALYDNHFKLSQYQLVPAVAIQIQECEYFGINKPYDHCSNIASVPKPVTKFSAIFKLRKVKLEFIKLLIYIRFWYTSRHFKVKFEK